MTTMMSKDNAQKNGKSPAKELRQLRMCIGRRTGKLIKINARQDSFGFDRIEDYFSDSTVSDSDSDHENEQNVAPNCSVKEKVNPRKLPPNYHIGRRTGSVFQINARKDSMGFDYIEDYFSDSNSETSMNTTKGKSTGKHKENHTNDKNHKTTKNVTMSTGDTDQENEPDVDQENMVSYTVPIATRDLVMPAEKEIEISPNLTGTAVKNITASCEPTPQFFGSKKRLFVASPIEINTPRTAKDTEEQIDVTGFNDDDDEVKSQINNKKQDQQESRKTVVTPSADDTLIVDIEDDESLTPKKSVVVATADDTLIVDIEDDESSTPKKPVVVPTADDTLIVDIEDDESSTPKKPVVVPTADDTMILDIEGDNSTFLTLGDKQRAPIALEQNDESAMDNSYQMDENLVLDGTRHKAMSPEFASTMESKGSDDKSMKEVSKPRGKRARTSSKSISNGRIQNNKEGIEGDVVTSPTKTKQINNEKKRGRKSNRTNRQENNGIRDSQDEENMATISSIADQTLEGNSTVTHEKKKAARKSTRKSRLKKDCENGGGKNSQDEDATMSFIANQTLASDSTVNHDKKKAARKSTRKSRLKKDCENGGEKNLQDKDATISSIADQTLSGDSTVNHGEKKPARKSTRKSKLKKDCENENRGEKNSQDEDATMSSIADQTLASDSTVNLEGKKAARKSTRTLEQRGEDASILPNESEESIMTMRSTRLNASRNASNMNKSLNDATQKQKKEKQSIPGRRSTRSGNKSIVSEKEQENHDAVHKGNDKSLNGFPPHDDNDAAAHYDATAHDYDTEAHDDNATAHDIDAAAYDIDAPAHHDIDVAAHYNARADKIDAAADDIDATAHDDEGNIHNDDDDEGEYHGTSAGNATNTTKINDNDTDVPQNIDKIKNQKKLLQRGKRKSKGAAWRAMLHNDAGDSSDDDDDKNLDKDKNKKSKQILKANRKDDVNHDSEKSKRGRENDGDLTNHDDGTCNDDELQHGDTQHDTSGGEQTDDVSSTPSYSSSNTSTKSDNQNKPKRKRKHQRVVAIGLIKRTRKPRGSKPANKSSSSDPSSEGEVTGLHSEKDQKRKRTRTTNKQDLKQTDMEGQTIPTKRDKVSEKTSNQSRSENDSDQHSTTKPARKRPILLAHSNHLSESSTPVAASPFNMQSGSAVIKSILKSSKQRTRLPDAAKTRRVSIAIDRNTATPSQAIDDDDDDDGGGGDDGSITNSRRRSSVSFAPTPSFRISPDDIMTPKESPGDMSKLSFVTNTSGFSSGDNTFNPAAYDSASPLSSSSSFSSLASMSRLSVTLDTSSVDQSREITIGSAKRRQIEEEGEENENLRRSKRTKLPALQYWKNERIKYQRRQSGWFIDGIEYVPTPKKPKRKQSKTAKQKKKKAVPVESSMEFDDVYQDGVPQDMEEVGSTVVPVINPDNGEEVLIDLFHTPGMLNFVNTGGKVAKPDDPLIVDKFMSHNLFGAGQLILRPGAEKGKQHVREDTMIFTVMKGRIEVTIHKTTVSLQAGSVFFVPQGNWYNLKNIQSLDARLNFVQIKGWKELQ